MFPSWFIDILTDNSENEQKWWKMSPGTRADIQGQGSILAWIGILSVYGADTIAEVKLFYLCADLLIYEIYNWVFKQF